MRLMYLLELPQFGGRLQLEIDEESISWQENTTRWSNENRSENWYSLF